MSSKFAGVTFDEQAATPSDDAIIRRAVLDDGVLTGCEFSYTGSTLTMTAGQLMICGRQIKHPSTQNWAVADATTGFARLLLTIDLTRTASKDTFEQVVDTVEYASALDGFADLVQDDINVSGTRYQLAACVVALASGGISGIVSQLGQTGGGTGGTLTVTTPGAGITVTASKDGKTKTKVSGADGTAVFKGLEGGTWSITMTDGSQTAQKTAIVTTDYAVALTFFAATIHVTYPEGSSCTATDGVTTLTAPDTSGTWACVVPNAGTWKITSVPGIDASEGTVVISSNGEIKYADITKKYIFRSGSGKIVPFTTASEASLSVSSDKITINYSSITSASSAGHTTSAIDITSFKKLCITANITKLVGNSAWTGRICASKTQWSTSQQSFQAYKMFSADNAKKIYELDISSLSGNYYVGFWGGLAGSIYDIYLAM